MNSKLYVLLCITGLLSLSFLSSAQELLIDQIKIKNTSENLKEISTQITSANFPGTNSLRLPPPLNDDCSNARSIVVGDPCISGTTISGSIESGENSTCNTSPDQSVWYSFVATQTDMYVAIDLTASSGCFLGSTVFSDGCMPSNALNCEDISGGPLMNIHNLSGLTVSNTYYVRVIYNTTLAGCGGGPPSGRGADFCIRVAETEDCSGCGGPCGPACGFTSAPTVAQVTSSCPEYELHAPLNDGQSNTYCYTFTASNSTVTMGMIANTRGCTGGTVYGATWNVQPSGCSGVVQSGDLTNTTMTGLTVGQSYTYCYTPTAACLRLSQYPYFVGAAPLPIELISFTAEAKEKSVLIKWSTATELNNEWFEVQRSYDGYNFLTVKRVAGAINSSNTREYSTSDNVKKSGVVYYRLMQIDLDGKSSIFPATSVKIGKIEKFKVYPNPSKGKLKIDLISSTESEMNIEIVNVQSQVVFQKNISLTEGINNTELDLTGLNKGVYMLKLTGEKEQLTKRIVIRSK